MSSDSEDLDECLHAIRALFSSEDIPPILRLRLMHRAWLLLDGALSTNGELPADWARRDLLEPE